jgi:hypothetical protein
MGLILGGRGFDLFDDLILLNLKTLGWSKLNMDGELFLKENLSKSPLYENLKKRV